MYDYMLVSEGFAITCGTEAHCKAQAKWMRLPEGWEIIYTG